MEAAYVANVPQWLRDRVAAEYGYGERGGAEVAEVLEEVGAFLFETEFEQELLDELDDASHKWWTKVRGLFAKAFSLVTGRGADEDGEASLERAGGLSDAHAAMREMMDAVLASDGEEAVGVGEEGEEGDEKYSRRRSGTENAKNPREASPAIGRETNPMFAPEDSGVNISITDGNRKQILDSLDGLRGKNIPDPKQFLSALKRAFGFKSDKGSKYVHQIRDDERLTLRISDHRAKAIQFAERKEPTGNTSVVVKLFDTRFRSASGAELVQFVYYPDKFSKAKADDIVDGVKNWIDKGTFNGTLADSVESSGNGFLSRGEVVPLDAKEAGKKLSELVDDGGEVDVGGVNYSIVRPGKAFHVSAAKFDKFDSSFMGTGEGQQSYGWGTYFLTKRGVWRFYRREFSKWSASSEEDRIKARKLLRSAEDAWQTFLERGVRTKFYLLYASNPKFFEDPDVSDFDSQLLDAIVGVVSFCSQDNESPLYDPDYDAAIQSAKSALKDVESLLSKHQKSRSSLTKEFNEFLDSLSRAVELKNEYEILESEIYAPPYTYRVEFDETAENMLDWTKELTDEQFGRFLAALQKRNPKVASLIRYYDVRLLCKIHSIYFSSEEARDISLALDDAGFIGHKMPVGGMRTDNYSDGHNYVIYNADERVRITGRVRFSKVRGNGKNETNGTVETDYLDPSDFGEDGRVKPEILAEIEAEKAKILEDAQKNGSFMKAPNGAPSKLNAEQWVLVRTKRFKRWFGDWEAAANRKDEKDAGDMGDNGVSKVVDENGEPLVVYHGTGEKFYEFSHKFGMRNGASLGRGFYFTEDEDYARGYGNEIMGVFLNIRNPLEPGRNKISKEDLKRVIRRIDPNGDTVADYASSDRGYPGKEWYERSLEEAVNAIFSVSNNYVETSDSDILGELFSVWGGESALRGVADVLGYDGFIPKRTLSDDVKIAFFPEQIKSATENAGTYARENPDIRYSMPRGGRKLKDYEFFVTDTAAFNRLRSQVGTLWHDKDDIDAYYLDEFVFICKKGDEYGKFEILDILNQNSTPDEIERRKEEAKRRMAQLQARNVADANEIVWDELRLGVSDSAGLGDGGGAIRDASRASQSDDRNSAISDTEGVLSRDVIGSQDGRLFAYRVGGEFGRRHHRRILIGEYSRESYLDKYGLDVKIPEGGYKGLRASRVRRDSQRNFEDMIDERVRACAAKTLASGVDRRGEVLLTNDARNMGAAERSYIKAKVMQICQIVRAAAKNGSFTPGEARGAVAMAAYNLAQSDLYSSAYEQIYCGAATEASVRDKMQEEEKARARGERPEQLALPAGYSKSAGEAARKLKLASGQAAAMEQSERQEERRAESFRSHLSDMREKYGKDGKAASEVEAMDGFIKDALDGALPDAMITKLRGIRDGLERGEYEAREGADEAEQTALRNRLAAAGDVLTEATRALGIAKAMLERGMPSVKDAAAQNRADAADRESDARESEVEDAFEDLDPATEARRVVAQRKSFTGQVRGRRFPAGRKDARERCSCPGRA
ncbi:MAG: hypothetical protein ACI4P6_06090 [Candidatus Spyradosoma sp.]